MIMPKGTCILSSNIQLNSKRTECLSGNRMSMDSSHDIGSRLMNCTVDLESSGINSVHISSLTDVAFFVYKHEIRDFHEFERFEERIDPEMVWFDGIADGNMACTSLVTVSVFSHPSEGL
jgi:hypothetical protein